MHRVLVLVLDAGHWLAGDWVLVGLKLVARSLRLKLSLSSFRLHKNGLLLRSENE